MIGAGRRQCLIDRVAGAAAFSGLLGLFVAVPVGLAWGVGWPLPDGAPSPEAVMAALRYGQVAPGTLVRMLAIGLWLIWAAIVVSLGIEIVAVARGTVARVVPGLGAFQHAAGRIVATVMLISSVATRADADAPPLPYSAPAPVPAVRAPALLTAPGAPTDAGDSRSRAGARESTTTPPMWTVRRRDSLWTIAERTLGDGHRWREIATLNVGRRQPDGRRLGSDSTLIRPGWRLELPADGRVDTSPDRVTVARGDDLWSIAERHLGDGERWPEIHARNRGRPQPDGRRLRDPDVLQPGWTLHLPDPAQSDADTTAGEPRGPGPTHHDPPAPADAHDGVDEPANGRNADRADAAMRNGAYRESPVVARPPRPVESDEATQRRTGNNAPGQPDARSPVVERRQPAVTDERPAPVPARPVTPRTLPQPGDHDARPTTARRPAGTNGVAQPADHSDEAATIVAGAALAAVLIGLLQTRRRHWLRRRQYGEQPAAVDPEAAELERWLRSMADQDLRNRVDRTLRVMSDHFEAHDVAPEIRALEVGEQFTLHVAGDAEQPPGVTSSEDSGRWTLAPELDVAAPSAGAVRYVPTLVSCGRLPSRSLLYLNPLAVAGLGVVGSHDAVADVMTSWVTELAAGSAERGIEIVVVGRHHPLVERLPRVVIAPDPASAADRLRRTALQRSSRSVVLCNADSDDDGLHELLTAGQHPGAGVVVFGRPGLDTTVEVASERVRVRPGDVWLDAPSWLTPDDWDRFGDLLRRAGPHRSAGAVASPLLAAVTIDVASDDEPPAGHVVGLLGALTIDGRRPELHDDAAEALSYLVVHRTGADPATLRRILWPRHDCDDTRLKAALEKVDRAFESPVVVNTDDGRVELVDDVASDLGRCQLTVQGLDHLPPSEQARRLYTALHLVRGEPFADGAAWAHADGTALEAATLVVDLAHRLAMRALTIGDADRASWAVDRGLRAAPSSELLYRDRMRVADARGDASELDTVMRQAQRRAEADGGWVSDETEQCYRTLSGREVPRGEDRDAS